MVVDVFGVRSEGSKIVISSYPISIDLLDKAPWKLDEKILKPPCLPRAFDTQRSCLGVY